MNKVLKYNDILRVAGVSCKQSKTVLWHTLNITIKQFLEYNEYINLISQIEKLCYDEDGNWMQYAVDFNIRICIINSYINIDTPCSIDEQFYIVYCTDLFDVIYKYACKYQIDSIFNIFIKNKY